MKNSAHGRATGASKPRTCASPTVRPLRPCRELNSASASTTPPPACCTGESSCRAPETFATSAPIYAAGARTCCCRKVTRTFHPRARGFAFACPLPCPSADSRTTFARNFVHRPRLPPLPVYELSAYLCCSQAVRPEPWCEWPEPLSGAWNANSPRERAMSASARGCGARVRVDRVRAAHCMLE